jgi:predicted MPP superfamily phosphohydrolase
VRQIKGRRVAVGAGALALAGVAARALYVEPSSITLRRLEITVPGWTADGLRIGVISDLHTGAPYVGLGRVEEIVDMIAGERPDLVALLGDYVDPTVVFAEDVAPEAVARRLGRLWSPLGTVAVLGNHDSDEGGGRIAQALDRAGIRVLEDEATLLDDRLWVVGLADASTRAPDIGAAYAALPEGAVPLVLSHDPDLFPLLPPRPQLVLSGHTHGGQVSLPGIRSLWTPSRFGDRYTGDRVESLGPKRLVVSRGVGTSRLPVRFRARPEVAVLTVRSD